MGTRQGPLGRCLVPEVSEAHKPPECRLRRRRDGRVCPEHRTAEQGWEEGRTRTSVEGRRAREPQNWKHGDLNSLRQKNDAPQFLVSPRPGQGAELWMQPCETAVRGSGCSHQVCTPCQPRAGTPRKHRKWHRRTPLFLFLLLL